MISTCSEVRRSPVDFVYLVVETTNRGSIDLMAVDAALRKMLPMGICLCMVKSDKQQNLILAAKETRP